MPTDPAFWRRLRKEFEGLQPLGKFSLEWTSRPQVGWTDELLPSQWSWFRVPDESSKISLGAIALRGARALGYDSEDGWFDKLRRADFVKFKITGRGWWNKPDGTVYEWESGKLDDIVKHSIALCHVLETQSDGVGHPKPGRKREGWTRRSRTAAIGRSKSIRIRPEVVFAIRGKISQTAFARLLGVKKGTVMRAEKGLATKKTIAAIIHRAQTTGMKYTRDQLIVPDHQ